MFIVPHRGLGVLAALVFALGLVVFSRSLDGVARSGESPAAAASIVTDAKVASREITGLRAGDRS
jgi:hypothetical protein